MIPLTVTREELRAGPRRGSQEEIDAATKGLRKKPDITIGTMIETPRAAIRADEIAEEADFFSFGTNDLTQMAFGFSRDDVESRMMPAYLEQGLLKRNPFETIDADGVGELVRIGARLGRQTKPKLKLGVCGEHGGDPESIALFYDAGLDYVSCSPFRVPIARLAAAQAIVGAASSTRSDGASLHPSPAVSGVGLLAADGTSSFVDLDVEPWHWAVLLGIVVVLLLVDLLVLHREAHEIAPREAAIESAVWVSIGLGFSLLVWSGSAARRRPSTCRATSSSRASASTTSSCGRSS